MLNVFEQRCFFSIYFLYLCHLKEAVFVLSGLNKSFKKKLKLFYSIIIFFEFVENKYKNVR